MIEVSLPDMTYDPSGLNDASRVEVLETGLTLNVFNWCKKLITKLYQE